MSETETREHEYELVAVGTSNKVLGRLYWDGSKVASDNDKLLKRMKNTTIRGKKGRTLTVDDGVEFLQALPNYYRSYVSARKV